MRNDHQLCFLLLHKTCYSIHTRPNDRRAFCRSVHLSFHTFLRTAPQSSRLLLTCLRSVFVHQTEQLRSCKNTQSVWVFHAAGSRVWFDLLDGASVDVTALHLSSFTHVTFLTLSFYFLQFTATYFIVIMLSTSIHYLQEEGAIQIALN